MSDRYIERVVLGEDRGGLSWIIRIMLWPLSLLYRVGLSVYLSVYSTGLRKWHRLPASVISVGNLTFGGTGKTPAVQMICRMLLDQGMRVVILSRGHGGSADGPLVVSDGESILADSEVAGDEPVLLAKTLPGIPVVVGKDRRESGNLACERFNPDIIVLDDGLQYWQLHRDLDIVVLDARRPFGSGYVMPMGDLREPVSGLKRAGIVLLNHFSGVSEADRAALIKQVSRLASKAEIFCGSAEPVCFRNFATGEEIDLDWIKGRNVFAFCGIGRPKQFTDMLGLLGARITGSIAFADHHRFDENDIRRINDESTACGADAAITTEKDAARLAGAPIPNLYTLSIRLQIEDYSRFAQYFANWKNQENKPAAVQKAAD